MSFTALGLPDPVKRGVRAAGYTQPTPIQLGVVHPHAVAAGALGDELDRPR